MRHALLGAAFCAVLCLAALVPLSAGGQAHPLSASERAQSIIEQAFAAAKANEPKTRRYVYHERIEERRFNRKGKEKKRQAHTWDVTLFEMSDHRRLIAKDDRPLLPRTEAAEQRKLEKQIRKMQKESPRQRAQRRARFEKEREEGEEFLQEITRAFDFRLLGEEEIDGVATYLIAAEPKAGYRPVGRMAKALPKVRAKVWVAQDDYGWVQADIETFDDITWAGIHKLRQGAQIRFKQRRLDDEVWVTESWNVRLRARLALVYRLDAQLTGTYSNFRRFSTDTTVTGWTPTD